jgi:hypothetical protein
MKKTLVSLTERQMKVLTEEAEAVGISKSELLRRIMDRYLDSNKKVTKFDSKENAPQG